MSIAIRVNNLGKLYFINHNSANRNFREAIVEGTSSFIKGLLRPSPDRKRRKNEEEFWALRNISFDIKAGAKVGIIGRNGAGKSTLLKILCRITEPSIGEARLYGRVSSLLEVGTGFHPELTGRENIFLNGAILGMSRSEIKSKFDEIVSFAEVEKFLDTPVKHYSSGMYVRLAFSVAAHLEPEILLIDEVLAVGDISFQNKCIGKMESVAKHGRTIIFVSHNMTAIRSLCDEGIYLENGTILYQGDIDSTVKTYLAANMNQILSQRKNTSGLNHGVIISDVSTVNNEGEIIEEFPYHQPYKIKLELEVKTNNITFYTAVHIHDSNLETIIFTRDFEWQSEPPRPRKKGIYQYLITIPSPLLIPGKYYLSVHIVQIEQAILKVISRVDHIGCFYLTDPDSIQAKMGFRWQGKLSLPIRWDSLK
jgi:lipopolysaccharide transport system ATP-binding protein